MDVTFEECEAVLDAFRQSHRRLLNEQGVHGVQVIVGDDGLVVELLVTTADQQLALESLLVQKTVQYYYAGQMKKVPIHVVVKQHARAHARPGDSAHGDGLPGSGTLGWNIILNGKVVCLSNWHVFCANGNDTPIGWDLFLDGRREATLYAFQQLTISDNTWDYALGEYINTADALDHMRLCEDGSEIAYPQALSPSARFGATYSKVGDRPPTCRSGTLVGVGDRAINYHDGITRYFKRQLIFSKMTDPGDSGAMIICESDNTVTGLNFAGNDSETIANPLYLAPWKSLGISAVPGYERLYLPSFEGDAVIKHRFWSDRRAGSDCTGSGSKKNENVAESPKLQLFDLPDLSAGKLYLGWAMSREGVTWERTPPPPIRDIPVEMVLYRTVGGDFVGGTRHSPGIRTPRFYYYLCFG